DLSRNSMAAHRTRLKRMRLIRWMMIGELMRAAPMTMLRGLANSSSMRTALAGVASRHAVVQELAQDGVEGVAGPHQRVVDPLLGAAAADFDQVLFQRLQVAVAQGPRVAQEVGELLHALEPRRAGEGEIHLV